MEGLEKCLDSNIQVIFILFGDICSIASIVKRIKDAGKVAMVHLDLIAGISSREVSLDFIKIYTEADGIITTKNTLIRYARQLGLYTVLRFFVMDSMALANIEKQMAGDRRRFDSRSRGCDVGSKQRRHCDIGYRL